MLQPRRASGRCVRTTGGRRRHGDRRRSAQFEHAISSPQRSGSSPLPALSRTAAHAAPKRSPRAMESLREGDSLRPERLPAYVGRHSAPRAASVRGAAQIRHAPSMTEAGRGGSRPRQAVCPARQSTWAVWSGRRTIPIAVGMCSASVPPPSPPRRGDHLRGDRKHPARLQCQASSSASPRPHRALNP